MPQELLPAQEGAEWGKGGLEREREREGRRKSRWDNVEVKKKIKCTGKVAEKRFKGGRKRPGRNGEVKDKI